jgi:hypothetical protein
VQEKRSVEFWLQNLKERDNLKDLHVDWKKKLNIVLREIGWEKGTG